MGRAPPRGRGRRAAGESRSRSRCGARLGAGRARAPDPDRPHQAGRVRPRRGDPRCRGVRSGRLGGRRRGGVRPDAGRARTRPRRRLDAAHAVASSTGEQVAYAVGVAAGLVPDIAVAATQDCIQVHGGIGYTFEHDAHLYYRRALTLRALLGRASESYASVGALARSGVTRSHALDLPAEAEPLRREIKPQGAALAALGKDERVARLAADGWVQPHLARPWGRAASPLEQVIIHEELRAA